MLYGSLGPQASPAGIEALRAAFAAQQASTARDGALWPYADHPLADEVYRWIAESGQPRDYPLLALAVTALAAVSDVPLWRGLGAAHQVPAPGRIWTADPWASTTTRPDYAALWAASGVVLRIDDGRGLDLATLADGHQDWFPDPVTDDDLARLIHDSALMHERVRAEQEWLLTGTYRIGQPETRPDGITVLPATPVG